MPLFFATWLDFLSLSFIQHLFACFDSIHSFSMSTSIKRFSATSFPTNLASVFGFFRVAVGFVGFALATTSRVLALAEGLVSRRLFVEGIAVHLIIIQILALLVPFST